MKRGGGVAVSAGLVLAGLACGPRSTPAVREIPRGDGVWFTQGLSGGGSDPDALLLGAPFSRVFLPVRHLRPGAGGWAVEEMAPPRQPIRRLPVVLVVDADAGWEVALQAGPPEALLGVLRRAVSGALVERGLYGNVEGINLDLPFSAASVSEYGALLAKIRETLPKELYLTATLRWSPAEKEGDGLGAVLSSVDGLTAFVFGEQQRADPIATDALGEPWWAGYAPGARGIWRDASGAVRGIVGEGVLRALLDDPRVALGHDLSQDLSGLLLRLSGPVHAGGVEFPGGDHIAFRQPAFSEFLYRLGADSGGRRFAKGRVIALDGSVESERIFALGTVADVLLGRALLPDVRVAIEAQKSAIVVSLENGSFHATEISRTANWVDVDVPTGGIRDVEIGGFDRYEVFDPGGRPVSLGRATRVRFYETLIAPLERLESARILLRRRPPDGCCRFRHRALAASGTELAVDWAVPTPVTRDAAPRR